MSPKWLYPGENQASQLFKTGSSFAAGALSGDCCPAAGAEPRGASPPRSHFRAMAPRTLRMNDSPGSVKPTGGFPSFQKNLYHFEGAKYLPAPIFSVNAQRKRSVE